MNQKLTASDLDELLQGGGDVQSTVLEFGNAAIQRSTTDDISILTVTGVYTRPLGREIERLALQCRGNVGIEFKDVKPNPAIGKKFDGSVLGLLKALREKILARGNLFTLVHPPPELLDVLKLCGASDEFAVAGQDRRFPPATGVQGPPSRKTPAPVVLPQSTHLVQKRIESFNQSLKRTVSLEKGLDNAQKCVLRFLPRRPPQVEGYEFAFEYRSSEKVGGDFFDFIPLDADHLGLLIGDVSGHGLDAAILMGISKKVLSIRARDVGVGSPTEVLQRANRDLAPDFNKYSFVTVLYGILESSTGRFSFCRAGHEAPILFVPGGDARTVDSRGAPLGNEYGARGNDLYEDVTVEVPPGGYLFFCTDGLAESRDPRSSIYSRDRLLFSFRQVREESTCDLALRAVLRSVEEFSGGAHQEDDITTILLRRDDKGR